MELSGSGSARIGYDDVGDGVPILVIPGGGINSTRQFFDSAAPFNPSVEFSDRYRVITPDLRNAKGGTSYGPIEVERPWDSYTDDHIALVDSLGVSRFIAMGFCIGAPLIWNLIRRAPDRVAAAVIVQPSGFNPEHPNRFYDNYIRNWVPYMLAQHPEITQVDAEKFLGNLYRRNPDFVFTVTREFVSDCATPILILPDDTPPHPYEVAMDMALLSPSAQVSLFPWKDSPSLIRLALRHVGMFLDAHRGHATEGRGAEGRGAE